MEEVQGIGESEAASSIEDLLGDDLDTLEDVPAAKDEPEDKPEPEADPEGEPEEDAEEGEEEDEDEEGEPEEEADSGITDETLVDITIGEDVYEVNFAELRAGYLRNEEYVTKVQAYEADYDSKLADLESRESQLAEELRLASVMVTGDLAKYDTINWAALKEADPAKYSEIRLEAIEARERAQAVEARRNGINQMHQKAQQLRHEAYVRGQQALADKLVPGYREPAFLQALVTYGKDIGYSEEDISGISDARHLLLLNNARLYAEGQVRKKEAMDKKVTKDLPPVVKPGATKEKASTDRRVVKNATAALHRDKSVDAAAALLMTFDL